MKTSTNLGGGHARKFAALVIGAVLIHGSAAQAQVVKEGDIPPGTTVLDRPRPEFDPLGIPLGGFILRPRLAVSETYSDNVLAQQGTGKTGDFITDIMPSVSLESNWNNHFLGVRASADVGRFASKSKEDFVDWSVGTEGRLDIQRDSVLGGTAAYSQQHELRTSETDSRGTEPTQINVIDLGINFRQNFNRISLQPSITRSILTYTNVSTATGTPIINSDRDRTEDNYTLRIGYALAEPFEAFLRTAYNRRSYDRKLDDNGFDRDSRGYEAVVGTSINYTSILFGDVFAGWRAQHYDDARFGSIGGWTAGTNLIWNPTTLTSVKGTLSRSIEETTDVGASGYWSTIVGLRIDHELMRNVLVGVNGSVAFEDYRGTTRSDTIYTGGVTARYMLMRELYLNAAYTYSRRSSDVPTDSYTENAVTIGLSTQF